MSQNQAHKAYAQQQIFTASPAKLVLMCYEHAIGALNEAIRAIQENNVEKRWKANAKATEIIGHLWSTLEMEGGGEIAKNLDQLYNLMLSKLPDVDFKNSIETAQEVIKLLEPLRDAWRELANKFSEQDLAKARAQAELAHSQSAPAATPAPIPTPSASTTPVATAPLPQVAAAVPVAPPAAPASKNMGGYGAVKPRAPAPASQSSMTFSA